MSFLLQENGDFLLQENGDKIILDESAGGATALLLRLLMEGLFVSEFLLVMAVLT